MASFTEWKERAFLEDNLRDLQWKCGWCHSVEGACCPCGAADSFYVRSSLPKAKAEACSFYTTFSCVLFSTSSNVCSSSQPHRVPVGADASGHSMHVPMVDLDALITLGRNIFRARALILAEQICPTGEALLRKLRPFLSLAGALSTHHRWSSHLGVPCRDLEHSALLLPKLPGLPPVSVQVLLSAAGRPEQAHAMVCETNRYRQNPLHLAARRGCRQLLRHLLAVATPEQASSLNFAGDGYATEATVSRRWQRVSTLVHIGRWCLKLLCTRRGLGLSADCPALVRHVPDQQARLHNMTTKFPYSLL